MAFRRRTAMLQGRLLASRQRATIAGEAGRKPLLRFQHSLHPWRSDGERPCPRDGRYRISLATPTGRTSRLPGIGSVVLTTESGRFGVLPPLPSRSATGRRLSAMTASTVGERSAKPRWRSRIHAHYGVQMANGNAPGTADAGFHLQRRPAAVRVGPESVASS